jgi:CBS domain containing-hemolysin-like protein
MDDYQIIIWSLVFSALFSGLEIAFVSANRLRMELEKKGSNRPWLYEMYKHPSKFISTLLLGNNVSLVFYGFAAANILRIPVENILGTFGQNEFLILLVQTIISTVVILIIAEFIPKAIFSINPNKTLRVFTIPVFVLYFLFTPIVTFVYWLATGILKLGFGLKIEDESSELSGVELKDLVADIDEKDEESVSIGEEEKEIFKNVIDFKSIKIRECLIPRTEISAVDVTEDLLVLKNLFVSTGHSKMIIYRDNIDNIIGYVHSFDLFKNPENIGSILRPLNFIPETMMAHLVLSMFIKENKSMAVVVDEFGGTSGLVTMEDVMEEIFGEIEDEHDKGQLTEKQLAPNEFLFSGRIEIDHINEKYHLRIPQGDDYETLAGFIIINSGSIPVKGEELQIRDFKFSIIKATENRIEIVKMTVLPA